MKFSEQMVATFQGGKTVKYTYTHIHTHTHTTHTKKKELVQKTY